MKTTAEQIREKVESGRPVELIGPLRTEWPDAPDRFYRVSMIGIFEKMWPHVKRTTDGNAYEVNWHFSDESLIINAREMMRKGRARILEKAARGWL